MKTDNPLTLAYINAHPVDAARTLERLPQETAAGLLEQLDATAVAQVLGYMMPGTAAGVLAHFNKDDLEDQFDRIPAAAAARILKSAAADRTQALINRLQQHRMAELRYLMRYPLDRVGSHMQPADSALPDDLEPADILKRLRHRNSGGDHEVWIVDREHHLTGVISITTLLQADAGASLHSLMQAAPSALPARMSLSVARSQTTWHHWRRLPVTDDDGILVGLIDYQTLIQATADQAGVDERPDPMESMFELIRIYWIAIAALVDTLLQSQPSPSRADTDARQESNDAP